MARIEDNKFLLFGGKTQFIFDITEKLAPAVTSQSLVPSDLYKRVSNDNPINSNLTGKHQIIIKDDKLMLLFVATS